MINYSIFYATKALFTNKMPKRFKHERDRLKISMQYQVCPPDDEGRLHTRSGKTYASGTAPASKKIMFKGRKISSPVSLPSSPIETSTTEGMDSEEGRRISRKVSRQLNQLSLHQGLAPLMCMWDQNVNYCMT